MLNLLVRKDELQVRAVSYIILLVASFSFAVSGGGGKASIPNCKTAA